jgi:hypothetical protein
VTAVAPAVPPLLEQLCDDAAVFPPGNLPLGEAVPAHLDHLASRHRYLVGPFIVAAAHLPELADLVDGQPAGSFEVALTATEPATAASALSAADAIPALRVAALEVAVPPGIPAREVVPALDAAVAGRRGTAVFVELPRDERRGDLIGELSRTAYLAKLRIGGVRGELYPDERELAAAVAATTRAGLPFKATAGLHHAIRNTDPETGFEQHGFLNLIIAVDAALAGAEKAHLEELLAERDPGVVAERVRGVGDRGPRLREQFRSFGTCSITEPLEELTALGLLDLAEVRAEGDR